MDNNIFSEYLTFKQKESEIEVIEDSDHVIINCSENRHSNLIDILEDEYLLFEETESGVVVYEDSFDDIINILFEYSFQNELNEASPVRKVVVRGGKRKIVFRCPPGHKKIKRRCVRRPSSELARVKRGARKAARKSKSKRSRANRRRKISLKRRASFAKRRHK